MSHAARSGKNHPSPINPTLQSKLAKFGTIVAGMANHLETKTEIATVDDQSPIREVDHD